MNMTEYKFYRIDDSDNPGVAKVEILSKGKVFMGKQLFKIKIVEIVKASTFAKCKVGAKKTVIETLLSDAP